MGGAATRSITAVIPVGDHPLDVAVSPDGHYAVVPNLYSDTVSIVDLNTRSVAAHVPITGSEPYRVEITADGAYAVVGVINDGVTSSFSVISLSTLTEVRSFPSAPQGAIGFSVTVQPGLGLSTYKNTFTQFAVSSDNTTVVLPDRGNSRVVLYDLNTGSELAALATASYPAAVDVSPDGATAVVSHEGKISVLNLVTRSLTASFDTPDSLYWQVIRITPDKSHAIAAMLNNVIFVDLATETVRAYVDTGMEVTAVATTPDGAYAVVANGTTDTVSILDLTTDTVVATLPTATSPFDVLISPDGQTAYVGSVAGTDKVHFIRLAGAASTVVGTLATGNIGQMALTEDGATLGIYNYYDGNFVLVDTATRSLVAQVPVPTGAYDDPVAFSPDGSRAYVANSSGHRVLVLHVNGPASHLETIIPGIAYAGSVSVDSAGEFIYVGGVYGAGRTPAVYVVQAATNSVVRTVSLGPSKMYPQASYLSHADSVLYVSASTSALVFWHTGSVWSRSQALYRVSAAGSSSTLIDATPLTGTPSDLAFSEGLKSAIVALPDPDGVEIVDFSGSRTDGVHVIDLGAGQVVTGVDFGNRALPGLIQGSKWHDINGNGLWDQPDEPALEGWTIYLDLNGNKRLDEGAEPSAVTDAEGRYWFRDLEAGTYIVAEVPETGWEQTFPAAAAGGVHQLTLGPGELVSGRDFGNEPEIDFGDAPDPTYPTLLAGNGARHLAIGPLLGTNCDTEPEGQPTAAADGDDTGGSDDEDGVVFATALDRSGLSCQAQDRRSRSRGWPFSLGRSGR